MASVCIKSVQPSQCWLDFADDGGKSGAEKSDQEDSVMDFVDFEFRLNDPVTMISADELFSNGKLVPLHLAPLQAEPRMEIRSPASGEKVSGPELYSFSPKAPRCSSVWKELLGLKKAQSGEAESQKAASAYANSSRISNAKSLKHLLRLNARSPSSFPLLRDSDSEPLSISARASLSSSSTSSGADHEDLPRMSLDSDRITPGPMSRGRVARARPPALRRHSEMSAEGSISMRVDDLPSPLRSSVDSPRLNASGKVVFQGLERSSSIPTSSLSGGPKSRSRGMMKRSCSANVMVTPVLNVPVPVCSLRSTTKSVSVSGFGQLFSLPKREKEGSSAARKHISSNSNGVTKTKSEKWAAQSGIN